MQLTGSTRSLKSKKQCTWVLQCNTSASDVRPFMSPSCFLSTYTDYFLLHFIFFEYEWKLLSLQSSASFKYNKIAVFNPKSLPAAPWWQVILKRTECLIIAEASIKTSWNHFSLSAAFHFILFWPPPCHHFIFFVLARPGREGVWAQHEPVSAGYVQSPTNCQHGTNQHFTPTPRRSNWLWRRQKGTWCDGDMSVWNRKRGRRKRDRNRGREWNSRVAAPRRES